MVMHADYVQDGGSTMDSSTGSRESTLTGEWGGDIDASWVASRGVADTRSSLIDSYCQRSVTWSAVYSASDSVPIYGGEVW